MNLSVFSWFKRMAVPVLLSLVVLSSVAQSIVCTIEGTTTDTETKNLYLVESGADIRVKEEVSLFVSSTLSLLVSSSLRLNMNIELIREYCLSKPLATEDSAFGEDCVLLRVYGKIFAFLGLEHPDRVVLKCDPDRAIALRDRYEGICGAFHWNKKYWNEVHFDTDVPDEVILELVDHSLSEVLKKLPRKTREEYERLLRESR